MGQQLVMMLTLLITSKGIAAVPRASLVVLSGTLTAFGLPLEGVAVILGVDELMDMARTMVNLVGQLPGDGGDGAVGRRARPGGSRRAQPSPSRRARLDAAGASRPDPTRGHRSGLSSCWPSCLRGEPPARSHPMTRVAAPRFALVRLALVALAVAGRADPGRRRSRRRAAPSAPLAQPALRGHLRLHHRRDPHAQGGDELRRRRAGAGAALVPAWTPGAYELSWFARWVSNFTPTAGDQPLAWDKLDYDTWRISPAGAKSVTVRFDYLADTLDNAMAWARPELRAVQRHQRPALSRGPGPRLPGHGDDQDRAGLARRHRHAGVPQQAGTYREGNYHDLVDKPFFVGRMDYDSMQVAGAWTRLATYPAGAAHRPGAGEAVGRDRQGDPGRGRGVPGDAVAALHRDDDLRLDLRRRQRARAHQLARRHLQSAGSSATRSWPRSRPTRSSTPGT